jgi:hypothetical protein
MDFVAELLYSLLNQQQKSGSVNCIAKNRLMTIAMQGDVVDRTGKVQTWFPCHNSSSQKVKSQACPLREIIAEQSSLTKNKLTLICSLSLSDFLLAKKI